MYLPVHESKDRKALRRPCSAFDMKSHTMDGITSTSALEESSPAAENSPEFPINLTTKFVLLTFIVATAAALSAGMMCRIILFSQLMHMHNITCAIPPSTSTAIEGMSKKMQLQLPGLDETKLSLITFSTKLFQQDAPITSHTGHHLDRLDSLIGDSSDDEESSDDDDEDDDETGPNAKAKDSLHYPSGQHLSVDIENIDSDFINLNSEERLAQSIFSIIEESDVVKLFYHHSLVTSVVTCVGVGLNSRVSIHTWPQKGVMTMDLFTRRSKPLIPTLPVIRKLFGVPTDDVTKENSKEPLGPTMIWSYKLRGFREGFDSYKHYANPLDEDLGFFVGLRDLKVPMLSDGTDFQRVDIVELFDHRIRPHVTHEKPDKVLFLDGVQQSTSYGEAEYHEALVHPAMIAHASPKRVAIIGGGEGATLREVLKHNTVEEVVMVEIDEELVEMCQEYLPEWSNCTDIVGSDADSCFDDSRATVVFEDAFQWFGDRFGSVESVEEKFDVIIMDALDPDKLVDIVGSLYKENHFVESLFNGLSQDGVFVVQLGGADESSDPALEIASAKDTAHMMEGLENIGFKSILGYDEAHSHFYAPWTYLVCFKDIKSRDNWYRSSAEIEIELHKQLHRTKSGKPTLLYFDAPTMMNYQVLAKVDEIMYCRKEPTPWGCDKNLGGYPDLVHARNSTVLKSAYNPVFERHMRQTLSVGAKDATDFSVIAQVSSAIQETIGEKMSSRL